MASIILLCCVRMTIQRDIFSLELLRCLVLNSVKFYWSALNFASTWPNLAKYYHEIPLSGWILSSRAKSCQKSLNLVKITNSCRKLVCSLTKPTTFLITNHWMRSPLSCVVHSNHIIFERSLIVQSQFSAFHCTQNAIHCSVIASNS